MLELFQVCSSLGSETPVFGLSPYGKNAANLLNEQY
jgi:hypothetical protein